MRRRFMKLNVQEEENTYMYIQALSYGLSVSFSSNNIEYSIDNIDNWETLEADTQSPIINKGQKIYFRASILPAFNLMGIGTFSINRRCSIGGNVMSLLFGDNFLNENSLEGYERVFYRLFGDCYMIERVSPTLLPATILDDYCYEYMFGGCTNLVNAPELPATVMANWCYGRMFEGCTSLTTAPELPATTLTDYCYGSMFYGCTSLTTAPELPATSLANLCYGGMFEGCTSLTIAPKLPARELSINCYQGMFKGCTSLTTAPELPATVMANWCYGRMFEGCTSLTTAPELPATTLTDYCYGSMFYGCTNLTQAPELPATELKYSCYRSMFYGCTRLNYIKMLATNIPVSTCLTQWVDGVSPTGTFIKSKDATWDTTPGALGDSGVPAGWTVVNDGEESDSLNAILNINANNGEEGVRVYNYISERVPWISSAFDNFFIEGLYEGSMLSAKVINAIIKGNTLVLSYEGQGTYDMCSLSSDGYLTLVFYD